MWEDEVFPQLPRERQDQIEVVKTAYDSVVADLSYLTMPVTAGKRLYELFDKYGVKSKEELERKRPGALWEEVVLPNIENGKKLAQAIHARSGTNLIVPGVFDARRFEWTRDEYMVLWLRLITARAKEIYLAPEWEYASGGVAEFVRGMMLQFRLAFRENSLAIYNEREGLVSFSDGSMRVAYALKDVRERGYPDTRLEIEFQHLANIAQTLRNMKKRDEGLWEYHVQDAPERDTEWVLSAAHSLKVTPRSLL